MGFALTRSASRSIATRPSRVLVEGAIDLHCHFGPERLIAQLTNTVHALDPVEAARDAADLGLRGLVLKGHEFPTTLVAHVVRRQFPDLAVFGAICCDFPVGGVNPGAVEVALDAGAAVVWMPTISAAENNPFLALSGRPGLRIVNSEGELLDEVRDILDLVEAAGAILATGHVSAEEHLALARAFGASGRLVVTHAMQRGVGPRLTLAGCRQLAELGATIEFSAHSCMGPAADLGRVLDALKVLDPAQVVLSTDYGWSADLPRPAAGFASYLDALWEAGVSEALLVRWAATNPARLLGLD